MSDQQKNQPGSDWQSGQQKQGQGQQNQQGQGQSGQGLQGQNQQGQGQQSGQQDMNNPSKKPQSDYDKQQDQGQRKQG